MNLKKMLAASIGAVMMVATLVSIPLTKASTPYSRSMRPDLVITKVQVVPANPTIDDDISLAVTVKNVGRTTTGRFVLSAEEQTDQPLNNYEEEDSSNWIGRVKIRKLKPNMERTVYIQLSDLDEASLLGQHQFELMVDANNAIRERKESNNYAEYSFTVTAEGQPTPPTPPANGDDPAEGANPDFRNLSVTYNSEKIEAVLKLYTNSNNTPNYSQIYLYGSTNDEITFTSSQFALRRDGDKDGNFEQLLYTGTPIIVDANTIKMQIPAAYLYDMPQKQIWVYSISSQDRLPDNNGYLTATPVASTSSSPLLTVTKTQARGDVTAPKGAKRIGFLDLSFNMDNSSDVYLDYFTLTHRGTGSLTDLDAVIVDTGGTHYGFATLDPQNQKVTFDFRQNHGSPLIKAGSSFTVTLRADLQPNPTAGTYHQFYLNEIYAHLPNKGLNQDLRIYNTSNGIPTSNTITVGTDTAGTAMIAKTDGVLLPQSGGVNQKIAKFSIKTIGEDAKLNAITLQLEGSALNNNANIKNLFLSDASSGLVYSYQNILDPKNRVVFLLSQKLTLINGQTKEFNVLADISGQVPSGSSLRVYLSHPNYLYAEGTKYADSLDYGLLVEYSGYDNTSQNGSDASWTSINATTPNPAPSLTISVAPNPETPTYLEIPQGRAGNQFITYNFQTKNQPVTIKSLKISSAPIDGDISKYIAAIKVTSDRHGTVGQTNGFFGSQTYPNLNLYLPANSLTKFKIYADAARGDTVYPMGIKLGFATNNDDSIMAEDQNNNVVPLTVTSSSLMSNKLDIVKSGAFIIRNQTQNPATTVTPGQIKVDVLKFGLESTLEDFKPGYFKVAISGPNNLTALYLYDEQGVLYAGSAVQNDSNGNYFATFSPTSLLIKAGSSKNMMVKANFSSSAQSNSTNQVTLKNVSATGQSSYFVQNSELNYQGNTITTGSAPINSGDFMVKNQTQNSDTTVNPTGTSTMLKFGISATNEPFTLKSVYIGISGPNNITSLLLGEDQGSVYDTNLPVSPDGMGGYYVLFQPIAFTVNPGATKNMIVKAYFSSNAQPNTTNRLMLKKVSATGQSSNVTRNLYPNYQGNAVTIVSTTTTQGAFIVRNQAQNPDISINPGETKVEMLKFGLEATMENFTVKGAVFSISGPYSINNIQLYDDQGTVYASGGVVADSQGRLSASLLPGNLMIPAGGSKNIIIKANFKTNASPNTSNRLTLTKIYASGSSNNLTQYSYPNYQGNNVTVVPVPTSQPDALVTTRAELAKMAVTISKRAINTAGGPHFSDVPTTHPDYKYIETAYNEGWMPGYPDGIFKPEQAVSRAEVSKTAAVTFSLPSSVAEGQHYQDVTPDVWYYGPVETVFKFLGYSNNDNTSNFYPANNASDDFTNSTLDILDRITHSLGVMYGSNAPATQTVTAGQTNVTLLAVNIWGLWETLTLDKVQITAVDGNGSQFADINNSISAVSLMQGDNVVASGTFTNGYLELADLNKNIATYPSQEFKLVASLKSDAPVGQKFQLQIKKNSIYSPSGIITKDKKGIFNLINYPSATTFKTFDFKGPMTEVVTAAQ